MSPHDRPTDPLFPAPNRRGLFSNRRSTDSADPGELEGVSVPLCPDGLSPGPSPDSDHDPCRALLHTAQPMLDQHGELWLETTGRDVPQLIARATAAPAKAALQHLMNLHQIPLALPLVLHRLGDIARRSGRIHIAHRCHYHEGRLYVDLGDDVLCIQPGSICRCSPGDLPQTLRFVPASRTLPAPLQEDGGDPIQRMLSATGDIRRVSTIIGWLIAALRGPPYPLLVVHGSHAEAAAWALREVIDPQDGGVPQFPARVASLLRYAANRHVVTVATAELTPLHRTLLTHMSSGVSMLQTSGHVQTMAHPVICADASGDTLPPHGALEIQLARTDRQLVNLLTDNGFRGQLFSRLCHAMADALPLSLDNPPHSFDGVLTLISNVERYVNEWPAGTFEKEWHENMNNHAETFFENEPVAAIVRNIVDFDGKWAGTAMQFIERAHEKRYLNGQLLKKLPTEPKVLGIQFARLSQSMAQRGYHMEKVGRTANGFIWEFRRVVDHPATSD